MSSLSTSFGGIAMRNPFIIAASPATETVSGLVKCSEAGAGAVITKSIADYDETALPLGARRSHIDSRGFWATSTFRRETLPRASGVELVTQASRQIPIPVIASVAARGLDPELWLPICLELRDAGAAMLQLDLFYVPQPMCTDDSIRQLLCLFSALADSLSIPIVPKLNIELPAYLVADSFDQSKVAGISLLDSVRVPSSLSERKL